MFLHNRKNRRIKTSSLEKDDINHGQTLKTPHMKKANKRIFITSWKLPRPPKVFLFLIGWLTVLFVVLNMQSQSSKERLLFTDPRRLRRPQSPGDDMKNITTMEIDAVVTIATGEFSASRFVSTLRTYGQWTGPIYVLTDVSDPCNHEWHNYHPLDCSALTFVDVRPYYMSSPKMVPSIRNYFEEHHAMKCKWLKTQLFKLIPKSSNVEVILFVDADVEFVSPLHRVAAATTVSSIATSSTGSDADGRIPCDAYYFPERVGVNSSSPFNSGISIYTRYRSAKLLEAWSEDILSGTYDRDQEALVTALARSDAHVCPLPLYLLYFVSDSWITITNVLTCGAVHRRATFVHYTSSKSTWRMRQPCRVKINEEDTEFQGCRSFGFLDHWFPEGGKMRPD